MRGDWIYDQVQVEIEYRMGITPAGQRRHRAERPARRRSLWTALFSHRR